MSWRMRVESRLLHVVARVALRLSPPLRAKRVVDRVGQAMGKMDTADAREVLRSLGGSGTCLTRSLAVAARLTGAEIVILAAPVSYARGGLSEAGDPALFAHAWVEHAGVRIGDGGAQVSMELARLR
jgi:hypothetical protein